MRPLTGARNPMLLLENRQRSCEQNACCRLMLNPCKAGAPPSDPSHLPARLHRGPDSAALAPRSANRSLGCIVPTPSESITDAAAVLAVGNKATFMRPHCHYGRVIATSEWLTRTGSNDRSYPAAQFAHLQLYTGRKVGDPAASVARGGWGSEYVAAPRGTVLTTLHRRADPT